LRDTRLYTFSGFDITTNVDQYLKVIDELMAYDFNTFLAGI
jgi:hypothetical protein